MAFLSPSDRIPFLSSIAGLVAGLLVVNILALAGIPKRSASDLAIAHPRISAAAARDFVAAWQKMLNGTWYVESNFVRKADNGKSANSYIKQVQRFPDHLRDQDGTVDAEIRGRHILCVPSSGAAPLCNDTGPASTNQRSIDTTIDKLRANVLGNTRSYSVTRDGSNCFSLYVEPNRVTPQWGSKATFCFDPQSGALSSSKIVKDHATDTTVAKMIRNIVTDSDFALPAKVVSNVSVSPPTTTARRDSLAPTTIWKR